MNEEVIVVAVQHRLGPLGWFSHPLLRATVETPEGAAASFATLDLIAPVTTGQWPSPMMGALQDGPRRF